MTTEDPLVNALQELDRAQLRPLVRLFARLRQRAWSSYDAPKVAALWYALAVRVADEASRRNVEVHNLEQEAGMEVGEFLGARDRLLFEEAAEMLEKGLGEDDGPDDPANT